MRAVNWWFEPVARGRVAVLRLLVAVFVPIDLWWATPWVHHHGSVPSDLYRPVALARRLRVPAATELTVDVLRLGMTVLALTLGVAVVLHARHTDRTTARATDVGDVAIRAVGGLIAAAYLWWMLLAMSYGKVDHDRYGFLVLLAVLPTVAGARLGDRTTTASAGWAIRMTQVAVVATYFLAAIAKVRFGGWEWANGATFARAIIRRGTDLVGWTVDHPWLLVTGQWAMLLLEFAAPLLFAIRRQRTLVIVVACLYAFHVMTYATLSIVFLPHLVALASFLPLERLGWPARGQRAASRWAWGNEQAGVPPGMR